MRDGIVEWNSDSVGKLYNTGIGEPARVDSIKSALEKGRQVYETDKNYLEEKYKELKEKETNKDVRVEIIIPTLNEEGTIGELLQNIRVHTLPVELSVLVIDGGSTDRTVEICQRENVGVIKQKSKGKGSAMKEAAEYSNADILVFIDGDGTYSISDLGSLLEPILSDKADMVVGSRILGKREKGSISAFNMLGNKIFNNTINFAIHTKLTDSLSGYRAIRKKVFDELVLLSFDFEIEVEITVETLTKRYRVCEVPIKYGTRMEEAPTKLDPIGDGIKIGRTLLFILMNVNPIKFFAIIALGFIVVGIYPASYVIAEKISTGQIVSVPAVVLTSLLFVTAALSLVIGLVSELIVRSRRRVEYLINKRL